MAYQQHTQKVIVLLVSAFKASTEFFAVNAIATHISDWLTYSIPDRNKFVNSIMSDKARRFGEKHICYKLEQWNKTGTFDILNNISEYVTLVQLMDSLGNVNHAVSVV